jgi:hypothetical protein
MLTPKGMIEAQIRDGGDDVLSYNLSLDSIWLVEIFLAAYAALGIGLAIIRGNPGPLFLLLTSLFGFGYVAWLGLRENSPALMRGRRRSK